MNLKSQLAPKGIEFKPTEFMMSGKYCTILTIISYPKSIYEGYLANITSISGVKIAIKHIPIEFSTLQKMLNKEIADLKQRFQTENDKTIQERIRQDYESLEVFIQQLAATQARIFDFQMHLFISADTKEELEMKKMQVRNYIDGMGMRGVSLMFEQEKVLKSILPIFPKQDVENRVGTPVPSVTMAAMYPFIFDSIKDPGNATLFGVDFSGGVVLFNQFLYKIKKENNRNNANIIILGTSGSGKSTAAKLLLRNHLRNQYKVVCIDPEGELAEMARNMGGDFLDLGKGGAMGMINPLEIVSDIDEDDISEGLGHTIISSSLLSLKAFMKYYTPSIEEDVLNMFSEVVQDTYKRYKIDENTVFKSLKSADYPTFDDVYATVKGRLLSIFNIRELMNSDENIKNALFFNILKYAWGQCLDKSVDTVMCIDEAHVLLSSRNELGAEFLAQIQRRARKYNTGTIIITQQPTDFAAPNVIVHGKAIFDNASYYLVMGLRKQAVEDLSMLIDLNDSEKEGIKYYNQGEGLFICGNKRMRINVVVTQEELDSFGAGGGL